MREKAWRKESILTYIHKEEEEEEEEEGRKRRKKKTLLHMEHNQLIIYKLYNKNPKTKIVDHCLVKCLIYDL